MPRLAAALALVSVACAAQRGTIGAVLAQQPGGQLVVRETPKGLAAERAGVQEGDEILTIEGRDVRQMDAVALHNALSGDVGTPVKLTLIRGTEVVRVTLKRTAARRLGSNIPAPSK
jgi:C-terminal processing protease CtpA/Prc